jgi:hypothetical protein
VSETTSSPTACQIAQTEHKQALRFVALWNYLLFAIGIVVTLVLAFLLVWALIDEQWAAAVGAGVGGILELPLTAFLVGRRKEAREGLDDAREFVKKACVQSETAAGATGYNFADVERSFRLFGRIL